MAGLAVRRQRDAAREHPAPLRCLNSRAIATSAGEIYEPLRHVRNDFTPAALVKAGRMESTQIEALTA